jgi:hypothetical protein
VQNRKFVTANDGPVFCGWRINYEQVAYALADHIDAVPALWSGPRRIPERPIGPG